MSTYLPHKHIVSRLSKRQYQRIYKERVAISFYRFSRRKFKNLKINCRPDRLHRSSPSKAKILIVISFHVPELLFLPKPDHYFKAFIDADVFIDFS